MTDIRDRVRLIQSQMTTAIGSSFSEKELDQMRALIRGTVEFRDYLEGSDADLSKREYVCESVFAGIESFMSIKHAYSILQNSHPSGIELNASLSLYSLKVQFYSLFNEFVEEKDFEKKCRHLLDLYKLQLIFAGFAYA